jgi:hypothetical protein
MNRTPQNLPGSPPQPVVVPRPSPSDDGPAPAEKAPPHKGGPTLM